MKGMRRGASVRARLERTPADSQAWFRVRWLSGAFPMAASGCTDVCYVAPGDTGDTCVCDVSVTGRTVFTDATALPTRAEVEKRLTIGAPPPAHFDSGTYTRCATAACAARSPSVELFTRGTAAAPLLDSQAIFVIIVNATELSDGRTLYLANKESVVAVADGANATAYSFRNPPAFMTIIDPSQSDALHETEARGHLHRHRLGRIALIASGSLVD